MSLDRVSFSGSTGKKQRASFRAMVESLVAMGPKNACAKEVIGVDLCCTSLIFVGLTRTSKINASRGKQ